MERSNSFKFNVLAEVCSNRLADEYPAGKHLEDLSEDLKFTFSPPNSTEKKMTKKAQKLASSWTDAGSVLTGQRRASARNMPRKLEDRIRKKGGCDLELIIEKKLYHTDVNKGQNRLSMPLKQILSDGFLNQKEKMILKGIKERGRSNKPSDGVVVGFIEPCLEETTMLLKKRNFTSSSSYVLIKNWHKIALKNGLKKGDTVQVWFFRLEDRPWIALVKP